MIAVFGGSYGPPGASMGHNQDVIHGGEAAGGAMTPGAAGPPVLPHSPEPGRGSVKMTEAAQRLGVSRKVMQARVLRNPDMGWVDTSGQRARWYVYTDALDSPADPETVADLRTRVEQLSAELADIRARSAAAEIADLRARVMRAETANTLLIEAFELEEEALKRFRQVLGLHTTPGHVGDLVGGPPGDSPGGSARAKPPAHQ